MILFSEPQYSITNYIYNHGFENELDGWEIYSTKDTKKNVRTSSEYVKDGSNSLFIEGALDLSTIIRQKVQLDVGLCGKAVTFSIYSLLDYCEYSDDASINLVIEYQSTEGIWIRNQSNTLRPQSGWQRYSYVTVLPEVCDPSHPLALFHLLDPLKLFSHPLIGLRCHLHLLALISSSAAAISGYDFPVLTRYSVWACVYSSLSIQSPAYRFAVSSLRRIPLCPL